MEIILIVAVVLGIWKFTTRGRSRQIPSSGEGWGAAKVGAAERSSLVMGAAVPARRVVVTLWSGEARRWIRTASFALAVAFSMMNFFVLAIVGDNDLAVAEVSWFAGWFPLFAWPIAGMVLVGVHFGATRARRDHAEELFDSLPASRETRAFGCVSIAVVGVIVAIVLEFAFLIWLWRSAIVGTVDGRVLLEVLTGISVVIGAAFLGLIFARLLPWPPVPLALLVLIALVDGRLMEGTKQWSKRRWVSIWPGFPETLARFDSRPVTVHLLYVVAMTAMCAFVARLLFQTNWVRGISVIMSIAAVISLAVVQDARTNASDARSVALELQQPRDHQVCRTSRGVEVCAFKPFDAWLPDWNDIAQGVRENIPAERRRDTVIIQQLNTMDLTKLDPRVLAATSSIPDDPQRESAVLIGFDRLESYDHRFAYAASLAEHAVGLPYATAGSHTTCTASGQARGVIALWLAASAVDEGVAKLAKTPAPPWMPAGYFHGDQQQTFVVPWRSESSYTTDTVVWEPVDIALAHVLAKRPVREVRALVSLHWDELLNPNHGRDVMRTVFGIELLQPSSGLEKC